MGGKGSGPQPSPCGTPAKYRWHRVRKQDCAICKEAWRVYRKNNYRKKNGPSKKSGRSKQIALEARRIVLEAKLARGHCADCQRVITIDNYFAFDLDHIDPANKSFTISHKYKHVGLEALQAEIAKCRLLCAFCHRLRTHRDHHHLLQIAKIKRGHVVHPTLFDSTGS